MGGQAATTPARRPAAGTGGAKPGATSPVSARLEAVNGSGGKAGPVAKKNPTATATSGGKAHAGNPALDHKRITEAADKAAKDAAAKEAAEQARLRSDDKALADISKALGTAATDTLIQGVNAGSKIDKSNKDGDAATKAFQDVLSDKSKLLDEKAKQIEGLSKWHQGIVTSYEDIAERYKKAVTGLDGSERKGMETKAKSDYMAMSGLGAQAAGIQAGAMGGPATGLQQQLMGAAFQQQATSAYSSAQKNISAVDEQRRAMQFGMAQAASADERSSRQLGFNMEGQQIAAGVGVINTQTQMAGQSYGASMAGFAQDRGDAMDKYGLALNTIGANTAAQSYAPTARMALNNKEMMAGFTQQGLDLQRQTAGKSGNINPWAAAGTGAMVGGAVGGPWGAAAGAGIGFLGAYATNK